MGNDPLRIPGGVVYQEDAPEYVRQLYLRLLGREPDDAGSEEYTRRLKQGHASPAEVLQSFIESKEYASQQHLRYWHHEDGEAFVRAVYLRSQNRQPTQSELKTTLAKLIEGELTPSRLLFQFFPKQQP